jgi:hypothetical protein
MRSHSNPSHNLFLPRRSQSKQNRSWLLWQGSHPNQTSRLRQRSQCNQTSSLPLR